MDIIITMSILSVLGYIAVINRNAIDDSESYLNILSVSGLIVYGVWLIRNFIIFFKNDYGKSFTIGWYAMEFLLIYSTAILVLFYWILKKFS